MRSMLWIAGHAVVRASRRRQESAMLADHTWWALYTQTLYCSCWCGIFFKTMLLLFVCEALPFFGSVVSARKTCLVHWSSWPDVLNHVFLQTVA